MNVSLWNTPAAFLPWPWIQRAMDGVDSVVNRHAIEMAQELHLERTGTCPGCGRDTDW